MRTVWSIAPVGRAGAPAGRSRPSSRSARISRKIEALQQQVVRAERLATLGELAAGVVHELNNPLTSITVYAEYLVRKLESQGAEDADLEKLRRIGASAQRILRFSRDLVQYARPSGTRCRAGRSRRGRAPVGVDLRAPGRARRRSRSTVEVDPELPVVQAVGGQLEQVLINLITNAVHAVESGGRVVVRAQADSPSTVLLEVADSGPGVAEDDREQDLRAVLHDQAGRQGHRPRPADRAQHRRSAPRRDHASARSDLGGAAFRVVLPIVCRDLLVESAVRGQKGCAARSSLVVWACVMKPEVLLELLEAAAEQLGIRVSYEPLQTTVVGNGLRGGLCRVKGDMQCRVIVDKRATAEERVTTLATALAGFDTTELELPQKVREVLRTYEGTGPRRAA